MIRQRLHALDFLRVSAMELGLLLHAAVPYTKGCPDDWAVCDAARSGGFDLLNTVIHAFRMPAFFLMSGFFAVLLLDRVGLQDFVKNRARRIAVPLLVSCAVIVPVTRAVWIYGAFERPGAVLAGRFLPSLIAHFRELGLQVFETVWHLWFLEYLLLFYLGFLALRASHDRLGSAPVGDWLDAVATSLVSRWRAFWLAIPTFFCMLTMSGWNVDGIGESIPAPNMLVYYGLFFGAGTLLYRKGNNLDGLRKGWSLHLGLALGCVLPLMFVAGTFGAGLPESLQPWVDPFGRLLSAALTTLLLYGSMGLCFQLFDRESPLQRYLADASYFVYLTHFPLVALLGVWFAHLPWPALFKYSAVLTIAVSMLLAIYQIFIRHGPIGRTLHGPR